MKIASGAILKMNFRIARYIMRKKDYYKFVIILRDMRQMLKNKNKHEFKIEGEQMKITISGNEYKVLKIYKKGHPLQDLFLCQKESGGYIECFLRFQVEHQEPEKNEEGRHYWSEEEDEYIRKQLQSGKTRAEIKQGFNIKYRTSSAISKRIGMLQREKMVTA